MATAVVLTGVLGEAPAAAAPDVCAWTATAQRLLVNLGQDAPAAAIRAELVKLGFGPDGAAPAACASAGVSGPAGRAAPGSAPSPGSTGSVGGAAVPLQGTATKSLFASSGRPGATVPVAAGADLGAVAAQPGDVVELAAGQYSGFRPRSGAAGAYVTYRAAPGARVEITGGDGPLVDLSDAAYVHLDGLTVQGSPSFGIYANKADHIALTGVEVAGSADGGVVFLGASNVHVEGCDIHGNNAKGTSAEHEALSLAEGTAHFEVFNCKIHDNGEEGIDAKYASSDGAIHHNLAWANRGPNIYVDAADDITIHDNYAWGATSDDKPGIMLAVENYSQTRRISGVEVSNNTVWDNGAGNVLCWVESSGEFSDVVIRDNTLIGPQVGNCGEGVSVLGNHPGAIPQLVAGLVGESAQTSPAEAAGPAGESARISRDGETGEPARTSHDEEN